MHPILHPTLSLILIITTFTLIRIPKSSCQDQQYKTCGEPYQCGNINFTYPFWGGNRPNTCGYPGFKISCQGNVPRISAEPVIYRVIAPVDTTAHTLIVARDDLVSDICPRFLHNTTLDSSIFWFSNIVNVTLSYNCTIPPNFPQPIQFTCAVNSTTATPGFFSMDNNNTVQNFTNLVACSNSISVPINQARAQNLVSTTALIAALADGFSLQYKANNSICTDCTRSDGRCGYNLGSKSFACYCSDREYDLVCNDTSTQNRRGVNNNVKAPISIGTAIAGAIVAGVGIGWLIFWCRQRRKRLAAKAAQSYQSQSKDVSLPLASKSPTSAPSTVFSKIIPSNSSSKSEFGKETSYFGVQVFSYNELELATDHFAQSRELGDGGFGTVYHGILPDGRVVAVKRLYENNFKRVEQFINEVEILTHLRHQNLVTLFGCTSRRSRELLLVYEYIPNGTVADHLHGRRANSGLLSWPVRLNIAIETGDALAYLHASDIIHRDVKTNNILLDNDFHVKVADFGLSRLFPHDVTHVSTAPQGTPGYVDPEYYQCYQLTEKSDVYSFGVVLIELISSLQAVDTNRHRHDINLSNMAINKIQNHTLHELVDPSLEFGTNSSVRRMATLVAELAFRCLQQEKDMRPSMQEVVDGLRGIQNEGFNAQKVEVVDILVDDGGFLKDNISPPSPASSCS
ncbi:hypothetical protein ACH5RR_011675 [Cinchona calisaya]|uniref:non-specific serine/threonine protein kinase n=1 Tax=Cinchona calisaya TaxID=153742 RepID=A0ABD3A5P3_9GENT